MATILEISNYDIAGTGRPIDYTFDSRWLLPAVSDPHNLYVCLPVYKVTQKNQMKFHETQKLGMLALADTFCC